MALQSTVESQHLEEISKLKEKISQLESQLHNLKVDENTILESEERFRTLFNTMTLGVVYQDKIGNIISANPAAEEILGLTFCRE